MTKPYLVVGLKDLTHFDLHLTSCLCHLSRAGACVVHVKAILYDSLNTSSTHVFNLSSRPGLDGRLTRPQHDAAIQKSVREKLAEWEITGDPRFAGCMRQGAIEKGLAKAVALRTNLYITLGMLRCGERWWL